MAEHSYWTAIYAVRMLDCMIISAAEYIDGVQYALYHDAEEAITGDLPWPVKRGKSWDDVHAAACEEMGGPCLKGRLRADVRMVIKAADAISALVFADEEVKLGNMYFVQIRGELIWAVQQLKLDVASNLIKELGFDLSDARAFHNEMSHL